MQLVVGVPTWCEQDSIRQCVMSVLDQGPLVARVHVSDRSPNQESLRALASLPTDERVCARANPAPTALRNFVDTGIWMLDESGEDDWYALLAGDDWWGPTVATSCVSAIRQSGADIAFPAYVWAHEKNERRMRPLALEYRWGAVRQMRLVFGGVQAQSENIFYSIFTRRAFCSFLSELQSLDDEHAYGLDIGVSMRLAAKWRVVGVAGASVHRRPSITPGVDYVRMGVDPPDNDWSPLRRRVHSFAFLVRSLWRISAQAPSPWGLLVFRPGLAAFWLLRFVVWRVLADLRHPTRARIEPKGL